MKALIIKNVSVFLEEKEIVHDISLTVKPGEFHVIMGPNGSGKSTLLNGLMGHPAYLVKSQKSKVKSQIQINGKDITTAEPEERAKAGLMLAFQHPVTIPGVSIFNFLRIAHQQLQGKKVLGAVEFHKFIKEKMVALNLDESFLRRSINDGFSGGEKKKVEMLQLLVLQPTYALFDEIDTGLDVDALQAVSRGINTLKQQGVGILLVTHYQRILQHIDIDFVHILIKGKLIKTGDKTLVTAIEKDGYGTI